MHLEQLYDDGTRAWWYAGRDPERPSTMIDSNQYLVVHAGRGLLPDPGGVEVFPAALTAFGRAIPIADIDVLTASHQDPDIISSLELWLDVTSGVEVYAPWLWQTFISHFAPDADIRGIPDEGGPLRLGGSTDLTFVPAHYLHASGNHMIYDPRAKILFSADVGAALLPDDAPIVVEDFDRHVDAMTGFHQRWMPSNTAKRKWIERVRHLEIEQMCPQHGSIFRGDDVARFLQWFDELEVGLAA
ncbi:MAG: MBL fold metallo-hydrolase [Actinomycetota bacterium]